MATTITKYDTLINILKCEVLTEVNTTLTSKFNPIIEEINKDINTFNLLEKLDNLVKQVPAFKQLQSKYNNLQIEHQKLLHNNNSDISLVIKDIDNKEIDNKVKEPNITESTTLNVKLSKNNDNMSDYDASSLDNETITDDETSSESTCQSSQKNALIDKIEQAVNDNTNKNTNDNLNQETEGAEEEADEEGQEEDEEEEEEEGEEEGEESMVVNITKH